jgi:hypothetical protein
MVHLTLSPDFVLQAHGLFCCAAFPLLPGAAAWPGEGRLGAAPELPVELAKTTVIAGRKYLLLPGWVPRFLPGSPVHGNSNMWQIVEEAFRQILDPG